MRSKLFLFAGAVLMSIAMISMRENVTNTGSIKITALAGDKPSAGALVGVSTSQENLENSKYIFEGETNSTGVIIFKSVAPGTYYVDAAHEDFYGEAKVTVTDTEAAVTVKMTEGDGDEEEEGEEEE